jgi:hypothetical protein
MEGRIKIIHDYLTPQDIPIIGDIVLIKIPGEPDKEEVVLETTYSYTYRKTGDILYLRTIDLHRDQSSPRELNGYGFRVWKYKDPGWFCTRKGKRQGMSLRIITPIVPRSTAASIGTWSVVEKMSGDRDFRGLYIIPTAWTIRRTYYVEYSDREHAGVSVYLNDPWHLVLPVTRGKILSGGYIKFGVVNRNGDIPASTSDRRITSPRENDLFIKSYAVEKEE